MGQQRHSPEWSNLQLRSSAHSLTAPLTGIWRNIRPVPHFRDPWADFHIEPTEAEAIAAPSLCRRAPGPYLSYYRNYVSLHLGNSTADGVHAIMDRSAPDRLVFSYTRIMAAFPRFVPEPCTIGILGLGGGSLVKHSHREHPKSRIAVAEISPEIIALRREFHIPEDDARLAVTQVDAADFVRQHVRAFDVLLVDVFDEGGFLPRCGTKTFYRACRDALTNAGVLVLNFSGMHWKTAYRPLHRLFHGRVTLYICPDGDNVIVFANKGPLPSWLNRES